MLEDYLNGRSGISFEVLTSFAEPLFDLYELDPRSNKDMGKEARSASEMALMLAVLETARLFWAYFLLEQDVSERFLPDFEARLIGDQASEDERMDFLELIGIMAEHWDSFGPDQRKAAVVPGHPLPPFNRLLDEYGVLHSSDATVAVSPRYGPDKLELPEALALFARPLLDDPEIIEDPDLLEETLARAHAYWDLAQTSSSEYKYRLASIISTFARDENDSKRIKKEARFMVERFLQLFPEQKRRDS